MFEFGSNLIVGILNQGIASVGALVMEEISTNQLIFSTIYLRKGLVYFRSLLGPLEHKLIEPHNDKCNPKYKVIKRFQQKTKDWLGVCYPIGEMNQFRVNYNYAEWEIILDP